jgi:hypothetical protein
MRPTTNVKGGLPLRVLSAIVLAPGQGTRMHSDPVKFPHP